MERLVNFKCAEYLKACGYDDATKCFYNIKKGIDLKHGTVNLNHNLCDWKISAPSLLEANEWLTERHNMILEVVVREFSRYDIKFTYNLYKRDLDDGGLYTKDVDSSYYTTYSDALENAVIDALRIVKREMDRRAYLDSEDERRKERKCRNCTSYGGFGRAKKCDDWMRKHSKDANPNDGGVDACKDFDLKTIDDFDY